MFKPEISADGILDLIWFILLLPVLIGLVAFVFILSVALLALPALLLAAPVVLFYGLYKLVEWGTL